MSNENRDDIVRALGILEGTVNSLVSTWAEQDRQATEGRRLLYTRVADMSERLSVLAVRIGDVATLREKVESLQQQVGPLVETVGRIEPIVTRLETTHHKEQVVIGAGRGVWTLLAALAAGAFVKALDLFFATPHH